MVRVDPFDEALLAGKLRKYQEEANRPSPGHGGGEGF